MTTKSKKLPANLEEKKKKVILTNEAPTNTRNLYYSGAYRQLGVDNSFRLPEFKKDLKIHIIDNKDENKITFDLVGVDAPIANALRRILIAEIPTMAIEKVYIYNNTSIMQDEVLSHRLGLVPIKVDPRKFVFKNRATPDYTPAETVVFKLNVKCTKKANPKSDKEVDKYNNSYVRSGDLEWIPQAEQAELYDTIRPVFEDITLTKLRPGQEINLEVYCEKGIGKDHAKFSPVSTATYRLLPEITFKNDVLDADAQELVDLCPMQVFDIEDLGNDHRRAVVGRPRNCTVCRECIRPEKFDKSIKLGRIKDHFIFSVESTGALPARELFKEAVKELITKCNTFEKHLQKAARNELF